MTPPSLLQVRKSFSAKEALTTHSHLCCMCNSSPACSTPLSSTFLFGPTPMAQLTAPHFKQHRRRDSRYQSSPLFEPSHVLSSCHQYIHHRARGRHIHHPSNRGSVQRPYHRDVIPRPPRLRHPFLRIHFSHPRPGRQQRSYSARQRPQAVLHLLAQPRPVGRRCRYADAVERVGCASSANGRA